MKKFVWLVFKNSWDGHLIYNKTFQLAVDSGFFANTKLTKNSYLQSQLKISLIRLNHCIIIRSWLNIWNETKKWLWNAHLTNTFTNGWNWISEIIALYFTWYLLITIFCRAYALNVLFSSPTYICRLVRTIIIFMPGHFHFLPFFHIFLVIWRRAFWHSLYT